MGNILTIAAAVCTGIAAACLIYLLMTMSAEIRIDRENAGQKVQRFPIFFRMLLLFAPNVRFISENKAFASLRDKYTEMIAQAGFENNVSGGNFLAIQVLSTFVGAILAILMALRGSVLIGLVILLLLFIYPRVWLTTALQKRHIAIMKALPNMLDLLTLSVEAGKDFLSALRDILAKRKRDALGDEFQRTLHEIQLGKNRQDALREMAQRVRQPELTSVISSIVQADEMGVSIGQLLKIQSDQLRMKRFALAEKLANEAPVKILFPVVVLIFPAVLLLLMAPILLQAYSMLGK